MLTGQQFIVLRSLLYTKNLNKKSSGSTYLSFMRIPNTLIESFISSLMIMI